MNKKVRTILELDKILSKLSEYAVMNKSKEELLKSRVETSPAAAKKMLRETDEARIFTVKHSKVPLSALSDIAPSVKRLKIGAVLSCGELLALGHTLRCARGVIKYFL